MQIIDYQRKRTRALPEYISVISGAKCAKIRIDEIEMIEQEGRKLHVITPGKDYDFYGSLNTIAEALCERAFYRPMKTMIINLDQISDISGYNINFHSGQTVVVGKNALANMKKAFKRYLLRYPPYTLWEPASVAGACVSESEDEAEEGLPDGYYPAVKKGQELPS